MYSLEGGGNFEGEKGRSMGTRVSCRAFMDEWPRLDYFNRSVPEVLDF